MKSESIVFGLAGVCFGLIVGWVIANQQVPGRQPAIAAASASASQPAPTMPAQGSGTSDQSTSASGDQPVPLDASRVQALTAQAAQHPNDAGPRIQLGNMYFDAEQYQTAINWYQQALKLAPRDVDVSTDLGVCFYYTNQPDLALKQFNYSLSIDPRHLKTLLNIGVVRAFGKQDLEGAARAWQKLVDIAPNSPEGQAAKKALESMRQAHPGLGTGGASGP
ncbi:MAG TPA: tetratricopeptide repeat protein [Vicinamibacterales bacterium]|nr:tetratricopeptide repeat protein [Vicinamibacterales bacterium]